MSQPAGPAAETPDESAAESSAASAGPLRKDGERFETTINIEGMEETVQYEHIVNNQIGIEMDYDYEMFSRRSEGDLERFVSVYDDPANPDYYLEIWHSAEDAETAAESVSRELSEDYEIIRQHYREIPLCH